MGFLKRLRKPPLLRKTADGAAFDAFILNGGEVVEVVGESFYQEAFEEIVGPRRHQSANAEVMAFLIPEPDNPHDPEAVAVFVQLPHQGDIRKVGHLSRHSAQRYRSVLRRVVDQNQVPACNARITGGWYRGKSDQGSFGIGLDLARPQDAL